MQTGSRHNNHNFLSLLWKEVNSLFSVHLTFEWRLLGGGKRANFPIFDAATESDGLFGRVMAITIFDAGIESNQLFGSVKMATPSQKVSSIKF
jgi:hypothetical protein